MAINEELKAQILRYHFVEHWRVGTIAFQLAIHHSTVERVLGEAGVERERRRPRRPSKLDPYMAFITETLERFPTLTAARLFDMVKARGYPGAPDHFRHRIAQLRPRRPREAYLRLRTLPGEQAQVDWAHNGQAHHRTGTTPPDGLRPRAQLLALFVPALLPQRLPRQPRARPCRGVLRAGRGGHISSMMFRGTSSNLCAGPDDVAVASQRAVFAGGARVQGHITSALRFVMIFSPIHWRGGCHVGTVCPQARDRRPDP